MTVAIALILGGVILVFIESRVAKYVKINSLDEIDLRTSFLIGCFQVCALWPGISRSGATIVGGLICGLNSAVAAEFSFLIAVPLMCIAVTFDLLQSLQFLQFHQIGFFLLGFIVSFIVAVLAVKWFVALLTRIGLKPFGYYRIILGVLVMANYLLVYSR
jgi:undecaprenyl-diphosphatase